MKLDFSGAPRLLRTQQLACDFAVIGGGLAGVCCAVTAARAGIKVVLIQDRPVLGGNASSEIRLWILGATSHLGNNNRWAREGGVIDEILVENLYRNPEGNPVLLDALLLEKVVTEPNITLLLNTSVHDLEKRNADTIRSVRAFCGQNSTVYQIEAPLFCDASGDGIVGFMAGAAFRIGAEARSEFGENFAPVQAHGDLLGHTIYFYSKDTGRPVKFVPPSFALTNITKIPRFRDFNAHDFGCRLWWLEWGGQLDTVHDTEAIKWELWKVAYGAWNYIKNSGQFPDAETLTLEWVGASPGKRESRRFEGDYMLAQPDIVEQKEHADAVSFGGWAIDLHPPEGLYSKESGCIQWHSKGVFQIPSRCFYSRNIKNLFLAGRIISASHIAFGSTRVMATCAHGGQAVGMAAALCTKHGLNPRDLTMQPWIVELQQALLRAGQYIPGAALTDADDLAQSATLTATSELILDDFPPCGETRPLADSCAMMLPLQPGAAPRVGFLLDVAQDTELHAEHQQQSWKSHPGCDCEIHFHSPQSGRATTGVAGFRSIDRQPPLCFLLSDGKQRGDAPSQQSSADRCSLYRPKIQSRGSQVAVPATAARQRPRQLRVLAAGTSSWWKESGAANQPTACCFLHGKSDKRRHPSHLPAQCLGRWL